MRQPVSPRMGLDAPREALGPTPCHRQVAARANTQAARAFRTRMPPDNDGPVGVGLGMGIGMGLRTRLGARAGVGVDTTAHRQSTGNSGASARKASSAPSSTTCCVAPSVSPV